MMFVCLTTLSLLVSLGATTRVDLVFRNIVGGKYICPGWDHLYKYGNEESKNYAFVGDTPGLPLFISATYTDNCIFTFVQTDGHWGYLEHKNSKDVVSAYGENKVLTVLPGVYPWSYVALDQVRHLIINKESKYYASTNWVDFYLYPKDGDCFGLFNTIYPNMKYEMVSPTNLSKEVYVYGTPTLIGKWERINAWVNPLADRSYEYQITYGRSKTESTTFEFEYKWEASGGIEIDFFSASVSQSVRFMLSMTSETTWYEETKVTRTIHVKAGQSVVVWQYIYQVEAGDHKRVYRSDIIADTDDVNKEPDLETTG